MAKPVAPFVHGPIVDKSSVVEVSSVLANATVTLLVGGGPVGSTVASANGTVWVPISGSLAVGQTVVATQETTDGTSDPSPVGVPVVTIPNPLPPPVFESPMSTCMSQVRMGGLVPGAKLKVLVGGDPTKVAVQSQCARTDDVFGVDPSVALPVGSQLVATQEVAWMPPSLPVGSLKVDPVAGGGSPACTGNRAAVELRHDLAAALRNGPGGEFRTQEWRQVRECLQRGERLYGMGRAAARRGAARGETDYGALQPRWHGCEPHGRPGLASWRPPSSLRISARRLARSS